MNEINDDKKIKIINILMSLADNMACSATTFGGQGYDGFIYSRDTFKNVLEQYVITSKIE